MDWSWPPTALSGGFDFPFGLPVELFPPEAAWADQFAFLRAWGDDAYACGLECVRRATATLGRKHVLRASESEARTPFDAYHYRIIYQIFFGMRDVIGPLRRSRGTAVLPFQYRRLAAPDRVVVECCPGSVLKRAGVSHHTYKQPAGGPLTRPRRLTRHAILSWLATVLKFDDRFRRVTMRNPTVIRRHRHCRVRTRRLGAGYQAIASHPRSTGGDSIRSYAVVSGGSR